jgi:predicted metal-dependent phosphoesterase TrpH
MNSFIDGKEEKFLYDLDFRKSPTMARRSLKDSKLKAWDGHVHSFYSRDIKERPEFHPVKIFFNGIERGMDYITITDHDEYVQNEIVVEDLKGRPELLKRFVPGTEFTLKDKALGHAIHVNVYALSRKDFEKLKSLRENLILFIEYCVKNKLMFQYNHPFWFEMSNDPKISDKNFEAISKYGNLFPVIEVSNSNRAMHENLAGEFLAKSLNKGMTSSSDGHFADIGARGYTLARGRNFKEFWKNIINGRSHLIKQNLEPEILRNFALKTVNYIAFQTNMKRVGGKYRMETGNRKLAVMMGFFDRFPLFLRPILPIIRSKIKHSHLIEEYVENQDKLGRWAIEYLKSKRETEKQTAIIKPEFSG